MDLEVQHMTAAGEALLRLTPQRFLRECRTDGSRITRAANLVYHPYDQGAAKLMSVYQTMEALCSHSCENCRV